MKAVVDIVGIDDDGELAACANDLLMGVVRANCYLLRRYPGTFPELYTSGVRFRAEPWATMPTADEIARLAPSGYRPLPPIEHFPCYPLVLQRGWADCAPLSAIRVAWLRVVENEPDAALRYYVRSDGPPGTPNRRRWYHVEVRRGKAGGREIEDPSRRLDF